MVGNITILVLEVKSLKFGLTVVDPGRPEWLHCWVSTYEQEGLGLLPGRARSRVVGSIPSMASAGGS